jgi:hypothetical protein
MNVRSATVSRVLDGAGTVSLDVPLTDARAAELQHKRRIVLYLNQFGKVREIGRGIVDGIDRIGSEGDRRLTATGPDILGELKYGNTLFARKVSNQTISQAAATLTDIMQEWGWSQWASDASGTDNRINARFDGATVLKALQSLSQQQGLHLRLGTGKKVEIGAFGLGVGASDGDANGLTLVNAQHAGSEMLTNDDIAIIENCRQNSNSEDIITWLLPLAGGQNVDSALTLQYSNRSGDYPIHTMTGPDGRTLYFIRNVYAEAKYGTIVKVGTYKEISPLDNSDSAIQAASNAAYDAAVATLSRYSEPQVVYTLKLKKCQKTVRPGDKVRVQYSGDIEIEDGSGRIRLAYEDIEGEFWVIEVRESFGEEGGSVEIKVSNIDRYMHDIEQVIIGGLEQITVQGMVIQPSINQSNMGPFRDAIDPTHSVSVPLTITDSTFELDRCLLTVKSRPFRANAKAATQHDHLTMRVNDGTTPGTLALRTFTVIEQTTGNLFHFQAQTDTGAGATFISCQPNGTNTLDYGIYDDTQYPDQVSIKVDGALVAANLGTALSSFVVQLNIRDQLVNAAGGLRQQHTILIECSGGQGEIEVQIELYNKITPFKLG